MADTARFVVSVRLLHSWRLRWPFVLFVRGVRWKYRIGGGRWRDGGTVKVGR